ncbi:aspartate aminotransferase family protein [Candidatus Desantisbacteria bacterium]|nr:aspartate aminotransferase family protein [Candidatus Desantisbacteria bacterium]
MEFKKIKDNYNKYIMNTYLQNDICLINGKGIYVFDTEGKKYMDFISGISVINLGYSHPEWVKVLQKQINRIVHSSNLYYIEPQARLAELLIKNSINGKCFFCNSGAEANEAAIKLARKFSKDHYGENKFEIITMEKSFHGRTLATITATGQKKYQEGFSPLMPGFIYTPFNDFKALKNKVTKKTCAIMLELVQAEGGINVAEKKFIEDTAALCKDKNILLLIDEIQTGIGRCGEMFAYKLYNVDPDIFTLAKALGSGIPIGAMIAKKEIAETFKPGTHASTFGGNHLACIAALSTINTDLNKKLIANARETGKYLLECLMKIKNKYSFVKDVRGKGLLIGMELSYPAHPIVKKCQEKGILLNCIQNTVLRFAPPLIITKKEIDYMIKILDKELSQGGR